MSVTIVISDQAAAELRAALGNVIPTPPVPPTLPPQVDDATWSAHGFGPVRVIDLAWPVRENIRTQLLNIHTDEVLLCRFVSPPSGAAAQNAIIAIVEAPGWPATSRTVTVASTPYPTAPLCRPQVGIAPNVSLYSNKPYRPPAFGAAQNICVLAPSTVYYLAITHRTQTGAASLPTGQLGGININFQA